MFPRGPAIAPQLFLWEDTMLCSERCSEILIGRAQERITHQRALLATIKDPVLFAVCEDILRAMEAKIMRMQESNQKVSEVPPGGRE